VISTALWALWLGKDVDYVYYTLDTYIQGHRRSLILAEAELGMFSTFS